MRRGDLRDNKESRSKSPKLPSSNSSSFPNNKKYNSIPSDRFYTVKEEVTLRFYQVPKALYPTVLNTNALPSKMKKAFDKSLIIKGFTCFLVAETGLEPATFGL